MGPRGTLVSHVKHSKDWKYQCKPAPILFVEVYEFHLRSTNLVSYGIHIDDKFKVPVPAPASTHLDVASGFWHQVFYHQTLMRFWSDESATVHRQGTWICEYISVQNRLDLLGNYREMKCQRTSYFPKHHCLIHYVHSPERHGVSNQLQFYSLFNRFSKY